MITIAIDFDGVIHDPENKTTGHKMGAPLPDAQLVLKLLHSKGVTVIIHTLWARTESGKQACENWLKYFDCYYDEVTALKPPADMYLDNKGYHFTTWKECLPALDRLIQTGKF